MIPLPLKFTLAEFEAANDEWGINCGPGALAAVCGMSLDEVRRHMGDFEQKRYTNPSLMFAALKSAGMKYRLRQPGGAPGRAFDWPGYGLCRVQWHGPWMAPGVPIAARYRQTHWIGACIGDNGGIGVFDVNCLNNGTGWVSLPDWRTIAVPFILASCVKRSTGEWSLTHSIEIDE